MDIKRELLKAIKESPQLSFLELQMKLNLSREEIEKELDSLCEENLIIRTKTGISITPVNIDNINPNDLFEFYYITENGKKYLESI